MTINLDQLSIFSLLAMLAVAIYFDVRTERIPNWLIAAGTVVALTFHAVNSGTFGVLTSVGGLFIAMAILLPFYIAGVMGAGDVKLMAAVGAFTGMPLALLAVGFALGVGVLEAIAILVLRGTGRQTWERYRQMGRTILATGRIVYIRPGQGDAAGESFPFAIAIGVGTIGSLLSTASMGPQL